jgi:TonB-linked SusC/RagA family outer membrane protein
MKQGVRSRGSTPVWIVGTGSWRYVLACAATLGWAGGSIAAAQPPRRAPAGTIIGRVISADGEPLVGARVSVTGTRLEVSTATNGRYTIDAVSADTQWVVATRIGFGRDSQLVVVVNGQTARADFTLRPVAARLGATVTIGYGTSRRRDLTGAISSLSGDEVARTAAPSVDHAMLGRMPGVVVVTASGQPGAGAMVQIRGANSIAAGNQPLYVVDGVPVAATAAGISTNTVMTQGAGGLNPLAGLSPADIEHVDVLKDAAATAIYGARGSNGVVLITTRRGHDGRGMVRVGSSYGVQDVRRMLPLLDARQFAGMVNQANLNASGGTDSVYSDAEIAGLRTTDWQDAIFRRSSVQDHELSFSGGDRDTKYYLSANLRRHDGIVIGTGLDRGAFRLNVDQDLGARLQIGNSLTVSRQVGRILPHGGAGQDASSVLLNALLAPPDIPVRVPSGELNSGTNPLTNLPFANPVASALLITNTEEQNRLVGSGYAALDVTSWLALRTTAGVDYLASTQSFYSPATTLPGRNVAGRGSRGSMQTTTWLSENTIDVHREFDRRRSVQLLGGVTLQRTNAVAISGTSQGFLTDGLRENGLNTARTFVDVQTGAPHSSLLSYFSRANVGFADRYLVSVSGRVDGSSKFGAGNRHAFFPSVALAWRASEESPIRRLGVFDDLKLRASYGRTGNQDIGNHASLALLRSTVYTIGGERAIGYVPDRLANRDLRWETTSQADVGVDIALMRNRLVLNADWYDKRTTDLLLFVPVPRTSGFQSSLQNVGSVRNRGIELAVGAVNLTGVVGWTSSLNLAWNRNRVLDLGPDQEIRVGGGVGSGAGQQPSVVRVGEPINSFSGWVFAGLDTAGQPTYADLTGDGQVTEADRTIIGNAQPRYTGGLTNTLTFRGLRLDVFLQWSVGNKLYNINRSLLTTAGARGNQLADVLGAGSGTVPRPKLGNTFESRPSTLFVEDGSYLRGKALRLGYAVPSRWLQRAHMGAASAVELYLSAQNVFTVTSYSGYDPELSEYSLTNLHQGIDFGTYPQPRQITVGFSSAF